MSQENELLIKINVLQNRIESLIVASEDVLLAWTDEENQKESMLNLAQTVHEIKVKRREHIYE